MGAVRGGIGRTELGTALALGAGVLLGPGAAGGTTDFELQSGAFRAKPAVVMIGIEAAGTATFSCGAGEPVRVEPKPLTWIGSGAIVHADGWVATNGHVVQPFHEDNGARLGGELLERAVGQGCARALEKLPEAERARRVRALAASPASRITLVKKLFVTLSNGQVYPAAVRAYSAPAYLHAPGGEAAGLAPGRDIAILKIEARDLPVVRLARWSTDLVLGQSLFVIGFPSVVVFHELLSRETRFEPSVTVGRVSGFQRDVAGQRVIQTDAAIIQGNSGGPVFNASGEVVGAATFTSLQDDRVVQGFNFMIPVETLREAATQAGVTLTGRSRFSDLWSRGVDLYLQGSHVRALGALDAADAIHPGFPDVARVQRDCQLKYEQLGYLHREWVQWTLGAAGLVAGAVLLWLGGRHWLRARRRLLRRLIREELDRVRAGDA